MHPRVASGVAQAVVTIAVMWTLWCRDRERAVGGVVAVLVAERWLDRRSAVIREQSLVVNVGAVAMSGGTVTVIGNACGIQQVRGEDGSK